MDFGNQPGNSEIAFQLTSGTSGQPRVQCLAGAGLVFGDLTSPTAVPLNTWTHLAFTYDGTNGSIYINGTLATNGPMIFPAAPATRTNNFIGRSSWGDPYANAIIDEFRVWTVARTPEQIRGSFYKRLLGTEAGLLLYYKFDSTSGSVTYNYAEAGGADYDGTLVDGPAWVSRPSYLVTTATDGGAGSLRDAINTMPPGGYIHFAANLSGQNTFLTQGQLVVNNSLIIDASAVEGQMKVVGPIFGPAFRIFYIPNNTSTVILDSPFLVGGHAPDGSSGGNGEHGGAIYNSGTLLLANCTLAANGSGQGSPASYSTSTSTSVPARSGGGGGAIYNTGTLTLTDCTLFQNASGRGGSGEPHPVSGHPNSRGEDAANGGDG